MIVREVLLYPYSHAWGEKAFDLAPFIFRDEAALLILQLDAEHSAASADACHVLPLEGHFLDFDHTIHMLLLVMSADTPDRTNCPDEQRFRFPSSDAAG